MRKHTTLAKKQIPTGDLNCPEEVELAKSVKCMIGNKTAVGDAEEQFKLTQVKFGESGANPDPNPDPDVNHLMILTAQMPTVQQLLSRAQSLHLPPSQRREDPTGMQLKRERKKDKPKKMASLTCAD